MFNSGILLESYVLSGTPSKLHNNTEHLFINKAFQLSRPGAECVAKFILLSKSERFVLRQDTVYSLEGGLNLPNKNYWDYQLTFKFSLISLLTSIYESTQAEVQCWKKILSDCPWQESIWDFFQFLELLSFILFLLSGINPSVSVVYL